MNEKYTLKNFLEENDRLVLTYSVFLGFIALSSNIIDIRSKVDFTVLFSILALFCWVVALKSIFSKLFDLGWDLLLFIALSGSANLVLFQSLLSTVDQIFTITRLLYIFFQCCFIIFAYILFFKKLDSSKNHKLLLIVFGVLTLVGFIIYIYYLKFYTNPHLDQLNGIQNSK